MQFPPRHRRTPTDTAVPMINVVFLLLIFFMMAARIGPPLARDVDLPQAQADDTEPSDHGLSVSADGTLMILGLTGDAAWQSLAALPAGTQLTLYADADLPARQMAGILSRLSAIGVNGVRLAVQPR